MPPFEDVWTQFLELATRLRAAASEAAYSSKWKGASGIVIMKNVFTEPRFYLACEDYLYLWLHMATKSMCEAVVEGINKWVSEGVGAGPFAGGAKPNFADVCVFGCLKAIDRTTAWAEIMAETDVAPWYGRMREVVDPGNACTSRQ